jgi:hypothetical protein
MIKVAETISRSGLAEVAETISRNTNKLYYQSTYSRNKYKCIAEVAETSR